MKNKFAVIFVALLAAGALFFIAYRPFVSSLAKRQLQNIFKGSTVSVGPCAVNLSSLSVRNIEIKKASQYDIHIGKVRVLYSPLSLSRLMISEIELSDAAVNVDLKKASIHELLSLAAPQGPPATASPGIKIGGVKVENVRINVKSGDFNFDGAASAKIDLAGKAVDSLAAEIFSADYQGVKVEGVSVAFQEGQTPGHLAIRQVVYNKLKIKNIQGGVDIGAASVSLDPLSAETLEGRVSGQGTLAFDKGMAYSLVLDVAGVDLAQFVSDFELQERVGLTGKISGRIAVDGQGPAFRIAEGTLKSIEGGTLVIKDETILQNLAQRSQQSMGLLVDGFKDYHYNIGIMKISSDQGNLIGEVSLEGEKGRRDLTVVLHNFILRKEEL